MPFQAPHQPLSERIRSLSLAPDLRDVLAELAERTEQTGHAEEFTQMLDQAVRASEPLREPTGPRHRRDRSHLKVIKGGLAGLAPVAFLAAHSMPAAAAAGARLWLKSDHGRWIAAAALFGLAGATAGGTVAAVDSHAATIPHPHAIVRVHRHRHRGHGPVPAPVVPPLATRHASKHHPHHHHTDNDRPTATPGPSPTDTDTPTPAPTASATGTPTPTATTQDNGSPRAP